MISVVHQHKSLAELYSELCVRLREIQRQEDADQAECVWCHRDKGQHLGDGRCSFSALSHQFQNVRLDEKNSVNEALGLIERLKEL